MIVTIDANIIYQSLRSSIGASYKILQMVRHDEIKLALSSSVLTEYEAVLTRESSLSQNDIQNVLRFIAYISEKFEPSFLFRPNLKDEDDNIFVELAVVSQSKYLITRNLKDYRNSEWKFDYLEVVSPPDFLSKWGK